MSPRRPVRHPHAVRVAACAAICLALAACGSSDIGTPPLVRSVRLTPDTLRLQLGAVGRLQAAGLDETFSLVVARHASWRSAEPSVATVDDSGRVTATGLGIAHITATVGDVSATAAVVVTPVPIDRIDVTPSPLVIQEGDQTTLAAAAKDAAGHTLTGRQFSWSSDKESVARVSTAGVVTAVAPGTATITVSSEGVSATVSVSVTARPAIALSATGATFNAVATGGNPTSQQITVTNSGGGTLSGLAIGTITYGPGATGWLAASLSGTTAPATVTLQPTTGALAAGTYAATVPVTSSVAGNSPQNIAVTFVVGPGPSITLSQSSVTLTAQAFGPNPASQTVTITNGGGATLSGLSLGAPVYGAGASGWLTTATLSGTTAPATVNLQATTGALAPGTYTATLPVLSPVASNSPRQITVNFQVTPQPVICPSSNTAGFGAVPGGANPAPVVVTVNNCGGGTLSGLATSIAYAAGQPTGWLSAALGGTTAPTPLTLSATLGALAPGTYTATVTLTSTVPGVAPASVTATFAVTLAPAINLSSPSATFNAVATGGNPASQQITVTNSGGGTLSGLALGAITYGPGATGWLGASLNPTTAPATVTLQPTTGSLAAGTYTATVPVTSGVASNSPQNIAVTFVVGAGPSITLSSSSLTFNAVATGGSPASQQITVTNGGGATLSGLALGTITYGAGASGWLTTATLSPTTAPATITLQPTTGALAAGTYTATVPVTSPVASNSPRNISVTFVVAPGPSITLSQSSVSFTAQAFAANPATQTAGITNGGGGTLSGLAVGTITYGAGATGWLTTATLDQTTAPATLSLQPRTSGLSAGTYTATVPITSPVASNSPRSVNVTFTVTQQPVIALSPAAIADTLPATTNLSHAKTVTVTNTGGGTLSGLSLDAPVYAAGSATGWLTAALGGTTAPTSITLTFSGNGIPRGTHSATITVRSSVAGVTPQQLTVTFRTIYTLTQHVQPQVFDATVAGFPTCSASGCHNATGSAPQLPNASTSFTNLLGPSGTGTKYVTPFDVGIVAGSKNVLLERIDCFTATRTPMPRVASGSGTCAQTGPTLPQALRDIVRNWILDGAKQ